MIRSIIGMLAAFLALTSGTLALAQTTEVAKDKARLHLDMPGLQGGRETFEENGWNAAYTAVTACTTQMAKDSDFPLARACNSQLGPGRYYGPQHLQAMDEAWLKGWTLLKDQKIVVISTASGNVAEKVRTMRFKLDDAECIGFYIFGATVSGTTAIGSGGQSLGNANTRGFYCAAPGAALSDATAKAVLAGWKVYDDKRSVVFAP